jgi:CRISPR system Cascade subunit CasB
MDTNAFFDYLRRRAEADTSIVAILKRSAAQDPGMFPPAYPVVEPFVVGLHEGDRRLVYLVAGLWALAARKGEGGAPSGLAEAFRRLAMSAEASKNVEARFVALLDADIDELGWRLRHAIMLIASKGVAIDWPALLQDLFWWRNSSRRVQRNWARVFWRHDKPDVAAGSTQDAAASA